MPRYTHISIDQGIEIVLNCKTIEVKASKDVAYTLTVTNTDGYKIKKYLFTIKNGADIRMISEPMWKKARYVFSHFENAENFWSFKASHVKVYLFLYNKNGSLIGCGCNDTDKTGFEPNRRPFGKSTGGR
jgi:hypothetical protein